MTVFTPFTNQPKSRAFTLIEIMVVVSIVGVLIALALPGFKRVRDSANKARCVSNLNQMFSGIMGYSVDNEGTLPMPDDKSKQYQDAAWSAAIWTYVGYSPPLKYPENDLQGNAGADKNLFHCPVTKYYPKSKFKDICMPVCYDVGNRFSYGMNSGPSLTFYGSANAPMKMGMIKNPTSTALILEMHHFSGSSWVFHNAYGLLPHNRGCNVLYYDGHVDWLAYKNIPPDSASSNATAATFWNGN